MKLTLGFLDEQIRCRYETVLNGPVNLQKTISHIRLWEPGTETGARNAGQKEPEDLWLYPVPAADQERHALPRNVVPIFSYSPEKTETNGIPYAVIAPDGWTACLNYILSCISRFQEWNREVTYYCGIEHDIKKAFRLIREYLDVNLMLVNRSFRLIESELSQEAQEVVEYMLSSEDQFSKEYIKGLFESSPQMNDTLMTRGLHSFRYPQVEEKGFYISYYNFYDENRYLGRFIISSETILSFHKCRLLEALFAMIQTSYFRQYIQIQQPSLIAVHNDFSEIVSSGEVSEEKLAADFDRIGWGIVQEYEVFCLHWLEQSAVDNVETLTHSLLEHEFPSMLIITDERYGILCLHSVSAEQSPVFEEEFLSYLRKYRYLAGVSCTFCNLNQAGLYAKEAHIALQYNIRQKQNGILRFEDTLSSYALDRIRGEFPLKDLISPYLHKILDYDREHPGLSLYETLRTYIQSNFNMTEAAGKLFIHRTTFLYRMNKLNELVTIDYKDWNVLLGIMISYTLLDQ